MFRKIGCLVIMVIGFFAVGGNLLAQNWNWATALGSANSMAGFGIDVDASGNSYVTGYFEGTADFGNGIVLSGAGQRDIFVVKYDPMGVAVWAKAGGMDQTDFGQEIILDGLGGVYVTGAFTDSLRLSSGMGSLIVYSAGERDVFLAKLDVNTGDALWLTSGGGPSTDEGTSVTRIGNKMYVSGMYNGTANFGANVISSYGLSDAFVACFDEVTNLWTWTLGGGSSGTDEASAICNVGGNVFVTGSYDGAVFTFGGTNLGGVGKLDGFVTKLDGNGLAIWSSYIGGANQDETPTSIASDGTDIYVTGNSSGQNTIQFRATPVIAVQPPGLGADFWTSKFSSSTGLCQWAVAQGGAEIDVSNAILVASPNSVTVAGSFENAISLAGMPFMGPGHEIFVQSLNSSTGTPNSAFTATGPGGSVVHDIALGTNCSILGTGGFDQTVNFDSVSIASSGGTNGFVAQLEQFANAAPVHNLDSAIVCSGDSVTIQIVGLNASAIWESSTDNGLNWQTIVGVNVDSIRVSPVVTTLYRSTFSGPCVNGMDTTWVAAGGLNPAKINGLPDSACFAGTVLQFTYAPTMPIGTLTFSTPAFSDLGGGNAVFDPAVAGTGLHHVRYDYSDSLRCRLAATDSILVYTLPSVTFSGLNLSYCVGDTSAILLSGSVAPFGTFVGSNGSLIDQANGSALFYPALCTLFDTTWVVYAIVDNNGCSALDSQWTYYSTVVANAGPDQQICQGDSVVLGSPAVVGVDYLWSASGTGWSSIAAQPSFLPNNSMTCTLVVRNGFGCTDGDTVNVSVIPFPTADAGFDQTICFGDSVRIGGTIPQGYLTDWQSNSGFQSNLPNPVTFPLQTATFYLSLADTLAGCVNSDSVLITVVLPALPANAGQDQSLTALGPINLSGSDPQPGQGLWICAPNGLSISNPQSPITTLNVSQSGSWTMVWQVTNAPCPATKDSVNITVTLTELNLPTGFSPNDDQVNDVLVFEGLSAYPNNKLHIFNRWGIELLTFAPYLNDWNGSNENGQPLVEDTYYYVLELETGNSVNRYLVLKR
ncbi:MAG: gliding motility-associated C-terminal domain-containing protein [Bacteroidetes bacterium]|nr:gliding motility-associated C-terminal domain-containing protein [Bacteroidota bacterium]